jgi:hypothetical protein
MGRYRQHRRPRTTQERRVNGKRNSIDFDGYKVKVRASRNMSNLVEAWDDVNRSSCYDRSWKKFRKEQYKPKDVGEKTVGQLLIEGLEEFIKDLKSGIDLETKYRITRFD